MRLFGRRESLHEQLAREGGLDLQAVGETRPPGWMETGIHGVPRAREWDAVVAVDAEGVEGDRVRFVALADHTLLVEEGGDVEPLAATIDETTMSPPYRAEGARRSETQWAVGIRKIEVVELPDDPGGDELTLTVHDGDRNLLVDGEHAFGSIPQLEQFGSGRGGSYVVRARRLDGTTWEVEAMPL
ncbi:MAG: hypothetical protein ACM3QU_01315 [Verrucomicrobiota bacterium]